MPHEPTSTVRARRLRERRGRGVAMVAPVEIGEGGFEILLGNGLLKQHQTRDRNAVGEERFPFDFIPAPYPLIAPTLTSNYAASHSLNPGSGNERSCCTFEQSSDVSAALGGPSWSRKLHGSILGFKSGCFTAINWPTSSRDIRSLPAR